jgi:hypothetical protein
VDDLSTSAGVAYRQMCAGFDDYSLAMPWRVPDDPMAWSDLSEGEYGEIWDRVYEVFDFHPTTDAAQWPSFREPAGSTTWGLESVFAKADTEVEFLCAERDVAACLLDALVAAKGVDENVYALDWRHPGYRFDPSLARPPERIESWLVPALPNGDYYLFLAQDLRFGWLSHPWECSVCVYGDLLPSIRETAEHFGWRVLRQN